MIWGALSGALIFGGCSTIQETWRHNGPGTIWFENDDHERVSEPEYKRHKYVQGGVLLGLGLFFWIIIATYTAKEPESEKASGVDMR